MPRSRRIQFIALAVGIALLSAFDAFVLHGKLSHFGTGLVSKPAVFVYERSNTIHRIFTAALKFKTLADENTRLRELAAEFDQQAAKIEELTRENESLRSALGIPQGEVFVHTDAEVFNISATPTNVQALIDRGINVDVAQGDVAVTPSGAYVGVVREVYERYSVIRLSTDPGFETTARVRGKETVGIARGGADRGMWLDLIAQSDEVVEGDMIVSAGSDTLPAGLIIGRVSLVEANEAKLFKQVRIEPAWEDLLAGRVLILRKQ